MFDDDHVGPVSSDIRGLYEDVRSVLSNEGAALDRGWPSGGDPQAHMKTLQYLLFAFMTVEAGDDERERARKRLEDDPDDMMAAGAAAPHARWLQETQQRLAVRAIWQNYFENHDVFLLPTAFTAAFPHDHTMPIERRLVETVDGRRPYVPDLSSWIGTATLAGLPATVAPVGRTAAGLPAGIQIVAPMWEDGTAIEFAALLSAAIGGFTPPPAFKE